MEAPRFREYRELVAKWDTPPENTTCKHAVKKGEVIGYARKHVMCADCWRKWVNENAWADLSESM
jgi:hypothetical protein